MSNGKGSIWNRILGEIRNGSAPVFACNKFIVHPSRLFKRAREDETFADELEDAINEGRKYKSGEILRKSDNNRSPGSVPDILWDEFLDLLSTGVYSVNSALKMIGITRPTFNRKKERDPDFVGFVEDALARGREELEYVAAYRGAVGVDEQVIHQGMLCYRRDPETGDLERDVDGNPIPLTVQKPSDNLLMFMIRSRQAQSDGGGSGGFGNPDNRVSLVRERVMNRLEEISGRMIDVSDKKATGTDD